MAVPQEMTPGVGLDRTRRPLDVTSPSTWLAIPILVFFAVSAFAFCWLPIMGPADTDLWTHLDTGRWIVEHQAIPSHAVWSFLSPPRSWVDYSWLFQVLVYQLYTAWGYEGLIGLRALLYLSSIVLVAGFFLGGERRVVARLYFTCLVLLYGLLLGYRDLMLRPHGWSYLFIIAFVYVLEERTRWAFWLPLMALLWVNLHGIEYVVLFLIIVSYATEVLVMNRSASTGAAKERQGLLMALGLCALAIYLTPHGARLLGWPFHVMSRGNAAAYQHFRELRPLTFADLAPFDRAPLVSFSSVLSVLLILVSLSALLALARRQGRVSHVMLVLGGAALLTGGLRFVFEFACVSMPLLKHHPVMTPRALQRRLSTRGALLAAGLLVLVTWGFLSPLVRERPRYPLSPHALPHGVASFLSHLPTSGFVWNHPDTGGYLRWALGARYQIVMDMQYPGPFDNADLFNAAGAFYDGEVRRKVLSQYEPSFLAVPFEHSAAFRHFIRRFPEYVLVFADDSTALYVNAQHHPDIAASYRLKHLDPFVFAAVDPYERSSDEPLVPC